ncbi:MAG: ComF family protein [Tidjanibacter sp.]|nr:ComF family protein [Tidjanibacter sp.]
MSLVQDLFRLFVPPTCPACGKLLIDGEHSFCTRCRMDAPLTTQPYSPANRLLDHLRETLPIERAAALMAFPKGSGWREVVHRFKYKRQWRAALDCGRWLGDALAEGGWFYGVDIVVAVPLHPLKQLRRSYNQADYIADGVAERLERPRVRGAVVRVRNNPSQALKRTDERWDNVAGIFAVRNAKALEGKHILLVDDVITSGATIGSCAEAILRAVPSAKVSIAAFATAHYI